MKREIALLTIGVGLGLMGLTGYDITYAKPLLSEITKIAQAVHTPEATWYNCLTREAWTPEKRAWCQKVNALKNQSYQLPEVGRFQLRNGVYEDRVRRYRVVLVDKPGAIAFGDLNRDGKEDAVFLLAANTGGSGVFVHLTTATHERNRFKQAASTLLGDRVNVESIRINGNHIKLDMVVQGPNEPMCCPTQKVSRLYELERDKLVPVHS
jgi:hypothetical protein